MTTVNQIEKLMAVGEAALKFAMAIDQKDTLELTDKLSNEAIKRDLMDMSGFKYEDRKEVQVLNIVKDLQGLDIKRQKLSYAPTIATYWSYSRNALGQKSNLFDFSQKWFKTSVWGLNMSVPIFDAGQKGQRIRQAKLNLEKTANTLDNVKRAIDLQVQAATIIFNNSLTSLDMQERNVTLAEKVYNTTKKKYEQGLGSSFELLQTETELETAEGNYFQALYDAINARISYLKALGKI
jgi:outer membrane protein TolC